MLLYATITAFVISFVCVTLIMLTMHQYKITDAECKRKEAMQWVKAGIEYAHYLCSTGAVTSVPYTTTLPDNSDVEVLIDSPASGDPPGVTYRIQIDATYVS
jgi:hypothetical protein